MTDQTLFVDAYSLTTRVKQRIPRHWLDDPILGRDFAKTPAQRELDGELPPRPPGDATAEEIGAFADAAGLDLSQIESEAEKLVAIEEALASTGSAPVQSGVVDAVAPAPADDPLAPEKVARVDAPVPEPAADDVAEPASDEPYAGDEWTFQALKDEIDSRNASREDADRISKGGSADDLRERLAQDDAAQAESSTDDASSSADESTTSTDDTESSDDTPAAGDEEN